MYTIVGGDGGEYGPVSAEQIRLWITEGRVDGRTRIRPEGATEWTTVGVLSEFTEALAVRYIPPLVLPPGRGSEVEQLTAQALSRNVSINPLHYVEQGWQLLRSGFGLLLGASFIVLFLSFAAGAVPFLGVILGLVVTGGLLGGLYYLFLRRARGEEVGVADAFAGFGPNFVQLMMAGILIQVLSGIGYIFCLIPGIYLAVAWKFALVLNLDKRLDFWPAMEVSRRVITKHWLGFAGILAITYLPVIGFDIYSTVQIVQMLLPMMKEGGVFQGGNLDPAVIARLTSAALQLALMRQLVLWLCTPLAFAALMRAYEDLFGTRPAPRA